MEIASRADQRALSHSAGQQAIAAEASSGGSERREAARAMTEGSPERQAMERRPAERGSSMPAAAQARRRAQWPREDSIGIWRLAASGGEQRERMLKDSRSPAKAATMRGVARIISGKAWPKGPARSMERAEVGCLWPRKRSGNSGQLQTGLSAKAIDRAGSEAEAIARAMIQAGSPGKGERR